MNKRMSISICIERIEEVKAANSDEEIIDSAHAALTTLHILYNLGFNEVSLIEEGENG
jgi:hypothetical protein